MHGVWKTKKVSVAMAAFEKERKSLLKDDLMMSLTCFSMTDPSVAYSLNENELCLFDKDVVFATRILLYQAQHKIWMRIEPILEQMSSNLV